jgi:hypothetical protein
MENAYNEAKPFLSDAKNNGSMVSPAACDFANLGGLEKQMPLTAQLLQQTGGLQPELLQQPQNFSQALSASRMAAQRAKGFLPENKQALMHGISSMIPFPGILPAMGMTDVTNEIKASAQMPKKNILFEACMINQPLNASLREQWSTGTYYFLK